jgi:transcriptional repressor NrdR
MRCPRCGTQDSKVVDSRPDKSGDSIRRRRECLECAARFTTYERLEITLPLLVKRDGRREIFAREKVLSGLRRACQKRPVSAETLDAVVDRVEAALADAQEREIPVSVVGDVIMSELKTIDGVAYLRFASVYHSFDTIGEFLAEAARVDRSS